MADTEVFNDDIHGCYARMNKYIIECQKSASANVAAISAADFGRFTNYLIVITSYVDWVVAQPILDLPETHPQMAALEDPPELLKVENLMIRDLTRMWARGRDELIASQSARNATGLISFDESRLRALILKQQTYLTDHVTNVSPVDMPESSPSTAEV